MMELKQDYSIVIVTHNMQQAARVSDKTAFFTVELGRRRAPHRPCRRVRRHREDLHQPVRLAHGGVRDRQGRLAWPTPPAPTSRTSSRRSRSRRSAGSTWSSTALDRALETVQHQDVELASMVIADDDRIDGRYLEVHQGVLSLLALQAPVAGDLRLVAALLHVIKHIERMGDQCVNMAKLVPLAGHEPPADERVLDHIQRMGAQARQQVDPVQAGVRAPRRGARPGPGAPGRRDRPAEPRRVPRSRSRSATTPITREWAMHMMLVGRCIERIGDNAVDIGEQTAFVVTGLFREFEDASHPELAPHPPLDLRLHRHRQQHHPAARGGRGQRPAARAGHAAGVHAHREEPRRRRLDPGGEDRRDRRGGAHPGGGGARGGRRADRRGGHGRDPQRAQPRRAGERRGGGRRHGARGAHRRGGGPALLRGRHAHAARRPPRARSR